MRLAIVAFVALGSLAGVARAQDGRELRSTRELAAACDDQDSPGEHTLYVVEVRARGWDFAGYRAPDRFLPIATDRNIRAFRGEAELFPSGMEAIGFGATPERARDLRRIHRSSRLRIGFFLGFDEPERAPCLIRWGTTTARIDVAYVELLGEDGGVLAREDTERLRAWLDDRDRGGIPGQGPRAALDPGRVSGAPQTPSGWQRTLAAAGAGPVGEALAACHAAGRERGASASGRVVVRLTVQPASGQVSRAVVELSSVGDPEEPDCIAEVLRTQLRLPPAPELARATVALSVPVRLAAD
jgi:hypothetical protein